MNSVATEGKKDWIARAMLLTSVAIAGVAIAVRAVAIVRAMKAESQEHAKKPLSSNSSMQPIGYRFRIVNIPFNRFLKATTRRVLASMIALSAAGCLELNIKGRLAGKE